MRWFILIIAMLQTKHRNAFSAFYKAISSYSILLPKYHKQIKTVLHYRLIENQDET